MLIAWSPAPTAIRSITHDMRNLLTAVRGHAELALRGLSPEDPAREDVAHCVVVTAAIFDLIDQLDGNDTSDTLVAVNLDTSVSAMRRLLDALLPPVDRAGRWHRTRDGAYVTISKLRIERIVLNLALNARDAMEDGGKLTVRTDRPSEDVARIIVSRHRARLQRGGPRAPLRGRLHDQGEHVAAAARAWRPWRRSWRVPAGLIERRLGGRRGRHHHGDRCPPPTWSRPDDGISD